jgi:CMP-N,N'-diacetyllegionaminic acid synthase
MNVVALIPAKGTSSRIPGKNLRPLGGKPLVAWTIEAALASEVVTRVLVSTECPDVAMAADEWGAEVLARPPELAHDPAEAQDVAVHAVQWLATARETPDVVVMLLPTSPFRTGRHIDEAFSWHAIDGRNVVSVTSRPEGRQKWHSTEEGAALARIAATHPVELNGAIWIATPGRVLADGGFETVGAWPYPMPRDAGLDIDRPLDWMLAEAILAERAVAA